MTMLSIIVPVYNVEKYLSKCIDSILAQTFTDFELILIDDGSPDNCGIICDEYAKKDSRIKVIHQKNQGVSAARNKGLDIAVGTYLGFVDSDDWIEPNMYEYMLRSINETDEDIIVCGINYCNNDGEYIRTDLMEDKHYNKEELMQALYGKPNPNGGVCWNKVFLRKIVSDVRFRQELSMAEDWVYLFDCFKLCKGAYHIPYSLYNVVERPESATRIKKVESIYKITQVCDTLLSLARSYSYDLETIAIDKFFDDCIRYSILIREIGQQTKQPYFWKFILIRMKMFVKLPRVLMYRLMPLNKLRGYLYEAIKI